MPLKGARIRDLRRARGIKSGQIAKQMKIGTNTLWRWETGQAEPSGDKVVQLAEILLTSTDYLLGVTDDPLPKIAEEDLTDMERLLIDAYRRGDVVRLMRLVLADK